MNKQQEKLSIIAMAIDTYRINPNSQKIAEFLTRLLESDLPLPDPDKDGVNKTSRVHVSQYKDKRRCRRWRGQSQRGTRRRI